MLISVVGVVAETVWLVWSETGCVVLAVSTVVDVLDVVVETVVVGLPAETYLVVDEVGMDHINEVDSLFIWLGDIVDAVVDLDDVGVGDVVDLAEVVVGDADDVIGP
jgi:hypothetical protein